MKKILDHDPLSGITTWFHYDELTDQTTIQDVADLTPLHERNYESKKDDDLTSRGIKKGMWHYASIHPLEQMIFQRKYGYSVFDKDRTKETLRIINTDPDFQRCKLTRKTHA